MLNSKTISVLIARCILITSIDELRKHKLNLDSSVGSDVAWKSRGQRLILASGTYFHDYLVIKIFMWSFFIFQRLKKMIYQLMTKGCALSTHTNW